MTILIAGYLDFDPEAAAQLITSAEPLIRAALEEEGCVAYSWSVDPLQPGRVRVFEEWTGESALRKHFEGLPYHDMGAHLRAAGMIGFSVNKYRSDLVEPVYDDSGTARADFFTAGDATLPAPDYRIR